MTTAEILSLVSQIAYVIAGVSLVLALFFWFKFNIPSVISDLSGRTARKSIEKIRAHNETQQARNKRPQKTAIKTDRTPAASKPVQSKQRTVADERQAPAADRPETGLLGDNRAQHPVEDATMVLDGVETTGLLSEDETEVLVQENVLPVRQVRGKKLTMLDEVMLIHTDDVIA